MKILAVINFQTQTNQLGCIRVLIPQIFYFILHKQGIDLSPQHSAASMRSKREHFAIMCVLAAQPCPTPCDPHGLQPPRLLCPWNSPGNNTGVGCHSLLQGIVLTQGVNPGFLNCRQIVYRLSHQGSPFVITVIIIMTITAIVHRALTSGSKNLSSIKSPTIYNISMRCMCAQPLSHVQLCDPIDCSPPGSSVHGILQARTVE